MPTAGLYRIVWQFYADTGELPHAIIRMTANKEMAVSLGGNKRGFVLPAEIGDLGDDPDFSSCSLKGASVIEESCE
jgi:hypothetical protein